jgi:hypothetical protein
VKTIVAEQVPTSHTGWIEAEFGEICGGTITHDSVLWTCTRVKHSSGAVHAAHYEQDEQGGRSMIGVAWTED